MKEERKEYVLSKQKPWRRLFTELSGHRDLLFLFAMRDLRLKYRQTLLGFAWVVLQPLIMTAIFSSVFASRTEADETSIPYSVLVFAGLIIYNMFSNGVSGASQSLVLHAHIIKKAYFPRLLLPVASVLSSSVDFLASLPVLLIFMAVMGVDIDLLQLLPYSMAAFSLALIPSIGFGILFSALNVRYRDISFVIPFFLMIMLFVSPIIYPIGTGSNELFQLVLQVNPLSGPIELLKAGLDTNREINGMVILTGQGIAILVLAAGLIAFNRVQQNIADIL